MERKIMLAADDSKDALSQVAERRGDRDELYGCAHRVDR